MDDFDKNSEDLIKHNIPKNNKTKVPIFKERKFKNYENYQGPDFYLLNRV